MNKVDEVATAMALVKGFKFAGFGEPAKELYRLMARAAIAAMEAPTEEMLAACWPLHHPWGENAPPTSERPSNFEAMKTGVAADWNAMIRAALSEEGTAK